MDIIDIMDIRDIMEVIEIMDIMDIMDIMNIMDIMIITAWLAMAGAVSALVNCIGVHFCCNISENEEIGLFCNISPKTSVAVSAH